MNKEEIHETTLEEYSHAINKYIDIMDCEDAYKINDYVSNLEYDNKKYKEVIDKIRDILNKMMYIGYSKELNESTIQYMATGEKSEFGARAKIILDILKEVE